MRHYLHSLLYMFCNILLDVVVRSDRLLQLRPYNKTRTLGTRPTSKQNDSRPGVLVGSLRSGHKFEVQAAFRHDTATHLK